MLRGVFGEVVLRDSLSGTERRLDPAEIRLSELRPPEGTAASWTVDGVGVVEVPHPTELADGDGRVFRLRPHASPGGELCIDAKLLGPYARVGDVWVRGTRLELGTDGVVARRRDGDEELPLRSLDELGPGTWDLFTGDGLCTALNVLRTVALTGRSLADLAGDLTSYPQVLLNVRVREKADVKTIPDVAAAIARVESRLAGQGRLLVTVLVAGPAQASGSSSTGPSPIAARSRLIICRNSLRSAMRVSSIGPSPCASGPPLDTAAARNVATCDFPTPG